MKTIQVRSLIPSLGLSGRPVGTIIDLPEDVALRKVAQGKAELVNKPESVMDKKEPENLDQMTLKQLRDLAKTKGLKGYSTKGKPELIKLLGGE
ncbi:hypothetical protein EG878_14525 [Enterococcus faecalis]|nr:hypothetical protein EG878_14525 [Enterococcus faecalis]